MEQFMLEKMPKDMGIYCYDGTCESLDSYEIKQLENHGVEVIFYYYEYGSYEGSGHMIALKEGKYAVHDMGHCSCYGPLNHFTYDFHYDSLDAILENATDESNSEYVPLINLAKEKGYK